MQSSNNQDTSPGPFLTQVDQTLDNGRNLIYLSRRYRKRLPPLSVGPDGTHIEPGRKASPWLRYSAPQRLAWWIAILFIIGSACFAYSGFASNWPNTLPPGLADTHLINRIFFIGSLFFTSAAGLQWLEAVNGDIADLPTSGAPSARHWRWWAWKPRDAGYMASLIQFIGALLFNLNTGDALLSGLNWRGEDLLIWVPNMTGSLCFLAASYLALMEIAHGWWSFKPRQVDWWIVIINLGGSVAFLIAAVYGFFPPSPQAGWVWDANLWTLVGALCFFAASYLMIPELFDADAAQPAPEPIQTAGPNR